MINRIIRFSLEHRLLTVFLVALLSLVGILIALRMPKDIYPDLSPPVVTIVTENEGMAAEDVERLITIPLESLMGGAPHVAKVRSESATGDALVTVEFEWGTDIYLARQIVSSNLEIVAGRLPQGTVGPHLGPVASRMGEVFEFAVVGDGVDPLELRSIADWTIRYRLQGTPGVAFIINMGGFVKQFQVFLKPELLHHYDLTVADVRTAVENGNRNFSGGVLTRGAQEQLIKGEGRLSGVEDIERTVIASRNNVPVFVGDVADVRVGGAFRRDDASYNAKPAIYVTVQKQYGGNTLDAIARVKQALAQIGEGLPESVRLEQFYDQSVLITKSIGHVQRSIIEGAVLIVLVMMLFLWDLRSSLISALTIPLSIFIAFIILALSGVSLTVMSLGGLAIGVGKVASGTIIMVENIVCAVREERGEGCILDATFRAAKDVGNHLFAASLIIILVFVPLLSLEGIEGAMFKPTAIAVAGALIGALALNLVLQPVLCSVFLKAEARHPEKNPVVDRLQRLYARWLERALDRPRPVYWGSAALVAVAAILYAVMGKEFVPPLDEGSIMASTVMLPETSLEESARISTQIEETFLTFPEVVSVARTTGTAEGSEHVHPVNHSHYNILLTPREERKRGYDELTAAMRAELDRIPGVAYIFEQPIANKLAEMLTGTGGELSVKLFGTDLAVLNEKIEEIHHVLEGVEGVADLHVEQTAGIPQLVVTLDRRELARYGIAVGDVADLVETSLNGIVVTDVYEADRVTPVLLRLGEEYRHDEERVANLLVDAPNGERIPLSQLAHIHHSEGPQEILRENLMRRKIILCSVVDRDVAGLVEEAREKIEASVALPAGYYVEFGGSFENQQRAMHDLAVLMAVVILLIFVILFSSFGSITQAALIIVTAPLSLVGAILGLFIAGQSINVSSMIGLIALIGVCVQNDVIVVAKIRDHLAAGLGLREAVMAGSLKKFRAILMTNLVMIVGSIPLAFHTGTGSELHRPLAMVYIGGFLGAIVLRMIALPVFFEGAMRLVKPLRRETVG
ncbi:MAG TPA: efflux RND transporter permease subunit [Longimicrobiales bacterium]|nr:efflux RND transporter permease subunit [Longimicrobiales bacterium]